MNFYCTCKEILNRRRENNKLELKVVERIIARDEKGEGGGTKKKEGQINEKEQIEKGRVFEEGGGERERGD